MVVRECDQVKCAFHKSKGPEAAALCPVCNSCGNISNIVEDDLCTECWNCLHDENVIRGGTPGAMEVVEEEVKPEPEMIVIEENI